VRRGRGRRFGLLIAAASALAITGCPGDDGPAQPANDAGPDAVAEAGAPEWRTVLEGLDGSLLSIWGTSSKDVWTVGGSLGNGSPSLVLRFDGTAWRRLSPGRDETYWWVHGTSDTDVWLAGEKGRITHWDGSAFREDASGTTATLFGVFAFARDDVWAVGGSPDQGSGPNDVLLHFDGTGWKAETLPASTNTALFKVWGPSKDDVYVVGDAGVIWHRTAGAWKREGEGVAKGRLTTVAGCSATQLFAVGGRDLLTGDGKGNWTRSDTLLVNDVNGVACANGKAVIVGGGSLKLRLDGDRWIDDFGSKPFEDLHGAWVDETGAFWGAGGKFSAAPRPGASRNGTVARYGPGGVPGALVQ
jgi:hypothetical protein